jgi:hypothetical protein
MSLVACGTVVNAEAAKESAPVARFITVEEKVGGLHVCTDIVVDTHTGVMYSYNESGHKIAMTVLLNTDGTPMIWEEWEK